MDKGEFSAILCIVCSVICSVLVGNEADKRFEDDLKAFDKLLKAFAQLDSTNPLTELVF